MTVIKEDILGLDLPVVCWYCSPCSAMENCPTEALEKNEAGLIIVDEKKCVGCEKCAETCVIRAIRLRPENKTPLICDQCGGKPQCVKRCPTKALTFVETAGQQPKPLNKILDELLGRWRKIA